MYQTPAGNRRSRRLASQEPSVAESDASDHDAEVVKADAERDNEAQARIASLEQDLQRAETRRDRSFPSRGQYTMKMAEIMQKYQQEKAEAEAAASPLPPPPTAQPATSPLPSTPSAAVAITPAVAPPTSVWRSITNLLATPFSRKRAAEDEPATPAPYQKRQKPIEPTAATVTETITTGDPATIEQPSPRPAINEQPTPAPAAKEQATTTPAPKRKRRTAVATATPLAAIVESSSKAPMTAVAPRRRTLASVRATKSATKPQQERRYAWEPAPKVKMPNADTRIAKVRHAEHLRRQLAALEQDEEVLRRVKKVKVDHLTEIPHNAPGDPSSTFRVPDIDSDDEIEVDYDVEVRPNIFETPQAPQQQARTEATAVTPATQPPQLPAQPPISALPPTPQLPAQQVSTPQPAPSIPQAQKTQIERPRFFFPSVEAIPTTYSVTPAYKEACGALFAAGLAAF